MEIVRLKEVPGLGGREPAFNTLHPEGVRPITAVQELGTQGSSSNVAYLFPDRVNIRSPDFPCRADPYEYLTASVTGIAAI